MSHCAETTIFSFASLAYNSLMYDSFQFAQSGTLCGYLGNSKLTSQQNKLN